MKANAIVRALALFSTLACATNVFAETCGPDALGTERVIRIGRDEAVAVGLKTYPRTLQLQDKELVLTFDDGPYPPTTRKVLDALKAECVRATFFLIGRNANAAPALAREEIAAGHSVGHHSFSHPAITLRNLPEAAAKADIDRGIADDDRAAYGAAAAGPRTPFFRYPGFGDSPTLNAWLTQRGISIFGADLWASDWLSMTPQAELSLLMSRIEKAGKGIVLLHDTKAATAAMMPAFLRQLKQRGYKIVHIEPGDGGTPVQAAFAGWTSETERSLAHMWPKAPPKLSGQKAAPANPPASLPSSNAPQED